MAHLHYFFVEPDCVSAPRMVLEGEEARHAIKVARLRVGEEVALFDGVGRLLKGTVESRDKRALVVAVTHEEREPPPEKRLVLFQAWMGKDRSVETVVRWGTELGVNDIVFFQGEHSSRPMKGQGEKWRRLAIESAKQCKRLWLPEFSVSPSLELALAAHVSASLLYGSIDEPPVAWGDAVGPGSLGIVIGPEGDFSPTEFALLRKRGGAPVSLGDTILRSDVAAVTACTLARHYMGLAE